MEILGVSWNGNMTNNTFFHLLLELYLLVLFMCLSNTSIFFTSKSVPHCSCVLLVPTSLGTKPPIMEQVTIQDIQCMYLQSNCPPNIITSENISKWRLRKFSENFFLLYSVCLSVCLWQECPPKLSTNIFFSEMFFLAATSSYISYVCVSVSTCLRHKNVH